MVRGSWRPTLLWPSALCLSRSPDAQPEAQGPSSLLDDGFLYCILSPTSLDPNSIGAPSPFGLVWLSLPHLVSNSVRSLAFWILVLTKIYNSSTPTQSPTQSLEWHVWSSLNGNNCHAVHRSLSSGASVYECIMGFLPCPISSAKSAHVISFDYWPLECVTSFRCISLEWHVCPGRRSKYNNHPLIIFHNSTCGIFFTFVSITLTHFYRTIYKDNNGWKHKKNHLNHSK